jgi:hypothetical protein
MADFCRQCGAPVGLAGFCSKCGSPIGGSPEATQAKARPALKADPNTIAKAGMSSAAKLAIAAVAIIFVGSTVAAAGIFYVAHGAGQRFHEVTNAVIGGGEGRNGSGAAKSSGGDPCRFVSKRVASQAIGVDILDAHADGESCSYLAKGNEGEMAAKHAAKMMSAKGADDKTQKMAEQFGVAIFKSMPQEKQDQGSDASGNVPVLGISVSDSASAVAEMKLNAKVMKRLGGSGMPATGEDVDIGDQGFVSSDSVISFRKGNKVVRMMYMTCPCGTKEVIPLAKQLAASL